MSGMFDENDNMSVPLEAVFENILERNKQLTLEVATLQTGNKILRGLIRDLQDEVHMLKNPDTDDIAGMWNSDIVEVGKDG